MVIYFIASFPILQILEDLFVIFLSSSFYVFPQCSLIHTLHYLFNFFRRVLMSVEFVTSKTQHHLISHTDSEKVASSDISPWSEWLEQSLKFSWARDTTSEQSITELFFLIYECCSLYCLVHIPSIDETGLCQKRGGEEGQVSISAVLLPSQPTLTQCWTRCQMQKAQTRQWHYPQREQPTACRLSFMLEASPSWVSLIQWRAEMPLSPSYNTAAGIYITGFIFSLNL